MTAYAFAEDSNLYEIIEGVKYYMSPAPILNHGKIVRNLLVIFGNYLEEHNCGDVFHDNTDVHLPDGNVFRPDVSVVCDLSIADRYGNINGVPDLVVEILSRSTQKHDRGVKMQVYERNGVKEYWIVSQLEKSIEVYHLLDGKYVLDEVYTLYSMKEWEMLEPEERAAAKFEIKVSLFDDLLVDVRKVFHWAGEPLPVYKV